MVRAEGFEPPRLSPLEPKSSASTSSATPAEDVSTSPFPPAQRFIRKAALGDRNHSESLGQWSECPALSEGVRHTNGGEAAVIRKSAFENNAEMRKRAWVRAADGQSPANRPHLPPLGSDEGQEASSPKNQARPRAKPTSRPMALSGKMRQCPERPHALYAARTEFRMPGHEQALASAPNGSSTGSGHAQRAWQKEPAAIFYRRRKLATGEGFAYLLSTAT